MKRIAATFSSLLPALALAGGMVCFLLFPARCMQGVLAGISLWAACVLPAAFPFLALTALFTRLKAFPRLSRAAAPAAGALFAVSGEGGCIALLSALSGYPVGAKAVQELAARSGLDGGELFRLSCLSSTSGPAFLVGTVGSAMFQSAACGWTLLLSHLLGVWIVCIVLGIPSRKKAYRAPSPHPPRREGESALYESLYGAVISVLCAGGAIALFTAFGELIASSGALAPLGRVPYAAALVRGLIEMTTGCALLAVERTALSLALCAFLVTFGGACVLTQQLAFLTKVGVRPLRFCAVKAVQGILAGAIAFALYPLFCL